MTTETGLSKEEDEEEDDTMQNTVVLFSNTDKFVLLQVQFVEQHRLFVYFIAQKQLQKIHKRHFPFYKYFSLLFQDMCVVCGSFGKGAEGQLLACAQCAQCYHPYCVNSKVSTTLSFQSFLFITTF